MGDAADDAERHADEPEQSTELDRPPELLNPMSGELIPVSDIARVSETLEALREHRRQVDTAIAAFSEPLLAESRRLGKKTIVAGALRVKISADHEVEWDTEVLLELRDLGLPEERYNELVKTTISEKVDGNVARQIAGASEAYADVIERAKRKIPKKQYVSFDS